MLRLAAFLTATATVATCAQSDALRAFFEHEARYMTGFGAGEAEDFKLERVRLQARIDLLQEQVDANGEELDRRIRAGTCDPSLVDLALDIGLTYARFAKAISDKAGHSEALLRKEMDWKNRALEAYIESVRSDR